jgi:hypothetical protein
VFNKVQRFAAKLDAYGHQDWGVPSFVKISLVAARAKARSP